MASDTSRLNELIRQARELQALRAADLRKYTGENDLAMAYGATLGRAQHVLGELADALERISGE